MRFIPWKKMTFFNQCQIISCPLALLIELIALVRVIRGSRHKFVMEILAILIAANLALFAEVFTVINAINTEYLT